MCGQQAKMTREHALPSWLGYLFDPSGNPEIKHRYEYPPEAGVPVREWTTRGFDLKVKSVCSACNQGWMSQLEGSTGALLTAMANAQRMALISAQCSLLTRWYAKTIVMLDLVHPANYQHIYPTLIDSVRKRVPPASGFALWAAVARRPCSASTGAMAMTVQTNKERPHDIRLSVLVLRQLVLMGVSHDDSDAPNASYMDTALTRLWPPRPITSFPPVERLTEQQLPLVLHMLAACIRWPKACRP